MKKGEFEDCSDSGPVEKKCPLPPKTEKRTKLRKHLKLGDKTLEIDLTINNQRS